MLWLSILIPSLETRAVFLAELLDILEPQLTSEVEVLVERDGGERTTGAKRNALLARAKGEYVVFVDDDDLVSDDYVSKIVEACKAQRADCIGYDVVKYVDGCYVATITQTLSNGGISHINPIRRSIAASVAFPPLTVSEDTLYVVELRPLLKTCTYVGGEPMYEYYLRTNKPYNFDTYESPNGNIRVMRPKQMVEELCKL